ncbi:MAG: ATP-binding protein [Acholeplasmataceae bacterium]|nr:ATP-binding protein [Acholeplasmataceae bacterium]
MLLKFIVSNYKSYVKESVLNMIPSSQKELEYSILKEKVNNKEIKALSSAVIYGPNAAGKTNIIGALECFQNIVKNGNIGNLQNERYNVAACFLELIPNSKLKTKKPVSFEICFSNGGKIFTYNLKIDIGLFMQLDYQRNILEEALFIDNDFVFKRFNNDVDVNDKYLFSNSGGKKSLKKSILTGLIKQGIKKEELFLTNGFKNIINSVLADEVVNYFLNKLKVVYRADKYQITKTFQKHEKIYFDKLLTNAAAVFGKSGNEIGFIKRPENKGSYMASFIDFSGEKGSMFLPIEVFESLGTIRFLNLFPLIKETLEEGKVLIIDEFDASIHPMALLNIVSVFHNDEINVNRAQLIFNTHNPIFLKNTVFRRDEIKFVEIDEEGSSVIYALSDFGTEGDKGVRKTEDYLKNYFINKYGAIEDVDFSDLLSNK